MLALAREAGERGGTYPCAFNAANEVAVAAFLDGRIGFLDIAALVERTLDTRRRRARRATSTSWARRTGGPPDRGDCAAAGMSIAVAILGLAFLVLIHEAGHFFAVAAVGMRRGSSTSASARRSLKTMRSGIEYGIGAIPLGGYVKIPGMHRPGRQGRRPRLLARAARGARSSSARPSASSARWPRKTTRRPTIRLAEFHQRALELGVPSDREAGHRSRGRALAARRTGARRRGSASPRSPPAR